MPGYYATDLALVGTGSDGDTTFALVEATAYASGTLVSASVPDTDSFIQGLASMTGLSSKSANTGSSIVYNKGSTLTINNGSVLNLWGIFGIPSALDTFAATNGGVMVLVGTSVSAISTYRVDGRDTIPYGGWQNYVVDLRNTPTGPNSAGGGVTNQYFGLAFRQVAAFKTAAPMALDAVRYGRQTLTAINGTSTTVDNVSPLDSTAANFPQMAYYNDYNMGGTPQLSATNIGLAVNGGYHRFGSIQAIDGGYSAKGILSLGTAATAVYFNDANRSISLEDTYNTYADFNRIEIRHVSSTIIWSAITFQALGSFSRGNFEMHDAATLTMTGCNFIDLGTFIFKSTAAVHSTTFRRCQQVTPATATFDQETLFVNSNSATGAILLTATGQESNMHACNFTDNTVAIRITGTYSSNPLVPSAFYFDGFQFANNTWDVDFAGTGYIDIYPTNSNISQGSVTATGGGTIVIKSTPVTFTVSNVPSGSEVRIRQGSYTLAYGSNIVSGTYSYNYEYSGDEPVRVSAIKPGFVIESIDAILTNTNSSVSLVSVPDPSYTVL